MSGVTGWNVSSGSKEDTLNTVSEWTCTVLCARHCLFIRVLRYREHISLCSFWATMYTTHSGRVYCISFRTPRSTPCSRARSLTCSLSWINASRSLRNSTVQTRTSVGATCDDFQRFIFQFFPSLSVQNVVSSVTYRRTFTLSFQRRDVWIESVQQLSGMQSISYNID